MEFLQGRALLNAVENLEMADEVRAALAKVSPTQTRAQPANRRSHATRRLHRYTTPPSRQLRSPYCPNATHTLGRRVARLVVEASDAETLDVLSVTPVSLTTTASPTQKAPRRPPPRLAPNASAPRGPASPSPGVSCIEPTGNRRRAL